MLQSRVALLLLLLLWGASVHEVVPRGGAWVLLCRPLRPKGQHGRCKLTLAAWGLLLRLRLLLLLVVAACVQGS
jgi:CHASE1-domain containing sensor protein